MDIFLEFMNFTRDLDEEIKQLRYIKNNKDGRIIVIKSLTQNVLSKYYLKGLFDDYKVICDESNNPPNKEYITCEIHYKVADRADIFVLNISIYPLSYVPHEEICKGLEEILSL